MPGLLASTAFQYPHEDYFSLMLRHSKGKTTITMQLLTATVNTIELPSTRKILKETLPHILRSKCFNDEQLPFSVEVAQTEIGHLFEHILLEYLCYLKLAKGSRDVVFSGTTDWNWYRDPKGMFHICINSGLSNMDIFPEALERSITLLDRIIRTDTLS